MKFLKSDQLFILAIGLITLSTLSTAHATAGGSSGGGGQRCQDVFESRRKDIADWIQAGADSVKNGTEPVGSALLDFKKSNTNLADYDQKMLAKIALTKTGEGDQSAIGCTDKAEDVMVDGKYKTCKAFGTSDQAQILCYSGILQDGKWTGGFMGSSDDDQYWQVHHEFAVLSGFEDQADRDSDYELSDQLVGRSGYPGFIVTEQVRKIALKPASESEQSGAINQCQNLDLRSVPVGTKCKTSKNVVFELEARTAEHHKEVWKDLKRHIIWSDRLDIAYDQNGADSACTSNHDTFEARGGEALQDIQYRLPGLKDFQTATADGFDEVLPNILNNTGLGINWTSSHRGQNGGIGGDSFFPGALAQNWVQWWPATQYLYVHCIGGK